MSQPQTTSYVVGVVDDEPGIRLLLTHLFQSHGFAVKAYDSAERLLEDGGDVAFGCLIVDIGLGGMSGLQLQAQLRICCGDLPTIVISGHATAAQVIEAFREKADAVFEKPFNSEELVRTVRALIEQSTYRAKARLERAVTVATLSAGEREVLPRIAAGQSTAEIARELGVGCDTVEKLRLRIHEKAGADSVIELNRLLCK